MTTPEKPPEKQRDNWLIVGRMKAGWHAEKENCRSDGGTFDGYIAGAKEGAAVYDGINCDYEAVARVVISGPMCKPELNGVQRFNSEDRKAAARMLPALGGGFKTATAYALAQGESEGDTYGSLDYVDWPTYKRILSKLDGIRFGVVKNGAVEWEESHPNN